MSSQTERILLTEDQIRTLKNELNHILWTTDIPEVPQDIKSFVHCPTNPEPGKLNIQCIAHAVVTSAILTARGFDLTWQAGMAFVLDTSPDGKPDNDMLNHIAKHWWLTIDEQGVVDLSLNAQTENPLVYCNRSIGGRWHVAFGETEEKVQHFLNVRKRGCFYLTINKKRETLGGLEQNLSGQFSAAKRLGLNVTFKTIASHCEGVISKTTKSLTALSQIEAWKQLSSKNHLRR